ncbi:hypothetical protein MTO98_24850 [Mucilaginibacter sp. SMC90]|uniref:hypothetical protein n=1 Tax=Mucilaginibacter sp. SMC90 TaxID=2929803 RepID=UPI001FB4CAF5|nr:hypothetical protein [Mucilaginibacter sp. SMC90]UOE47644.1 hypothetical protein MTO98_24850 [Mucilaginibacter sp. SMC90]
MNIITKATLYDHLAGATVSLLEIARKLSWNKITDNCLYITSEIENSTQGFCDLHKLRKQNNDQKMLRSLADVMPQLLSLYDNLHDINLYIYRAERNVTIIEIAYYLKTSLDAMYRETIITDPPMLHCKVPIPNYRALKEDRDKKFDINWQLNPLNHRLRVFWMRLKYKAGMYRF